jgi:hypothetical protein
MLADVYREQAGLVLTRDTSDVHNARREARGSVTRLCQQWKKTRSNEELRRDVCRESICPGFRVGFHQMI